MKSNKVIICALLARRKELGISSRKIAELMNTTSSAIIRLESVARKNSKRKVFNSPMLSTLDKYAEAVGCSVKITLEKQESNNERNI